VNSLGWPFTLPQVLSVELYVLQRFAAAFDQAHVPYLEGENFL